MNKAVGKTHWDFDLIEDDCKSQIEKTERLEAMEKAENYVLNQMLYGTGVDGRLEHWYKEEHVSKRIDPMRGFFYASLFSLPFWVSVAIILIKLF